MLLMDWPLPKVLGEPRLWGEGHVLEKAGKGHVSAVFRWSYFPPNTCAFSPRFTVKYLTREMFEIIYERRAFFFSNYSNFDFCPVCSMCRTHERYNRKFCHDLSPSCLFTLIYIFYDFFQKIIKNIYYSNYFCMFYF